MQKVNKIITTWDGVLYDDGTFEGEWYGGKWKNGEFTGESFVGNGTFEDIEKSIIKRSNFDLVIKAIGSKSDKHIDHEFIVYAGDCKIGGSTIVEAVASGIDSAKIMHNKIEGEKK